MIIFDISVTSVSRIINKCTDILWRQYAKGIIWPTLDQWAALQGRWPKIPSALGAIDGTSHRILRPRSDDQTSVYSGHRHYHCFHTIIIITADRNLAYVGAGYLGHCNDQRCYNLMPNIEENEPSHFHLSVCCWPTWDMQISTHLWHPTVGLTSPECHKTSVEEWERLTVLYDITDITVFISSYQSI